MFSSRLLAFYFIVEIVPLFFCSDCTTHSKNEKLILERLAPLKNTILQVNSTENKYRYLVAFCASVSDGTKDVGALQMEGKVNHTLGKISDVGLVSGTNWIMMTYNGGDQYQHQCNNDTRTAEIMLICDPAVDKGNLRLLMERTSTNGSNCFYMFEVSTRYACDPLPEDDTISGGGIFCILFFTMAGIYLLCGFLYQRLIVGAKGLEQIPNYTFWRDFGNLQADGCNFLCRCGPRHESQAYRGIDDRMPKETERDDQLLSM